MLALTANIASTLSTYPHTLSYFNEIAGGPLNGAAHLLDANIDWGQDLLYLKEWSDVRSVNSHLYLRYFSLLQPSVADIAFKPLPCDVGSISHFPGNSAISLNDLYAYRHFGHLGDCYASLRMCAPTEYVGYTFRVFANSSFRSPVHSTGSPPQD